MEVSGRKKKSKTLERIHRWKRSSGVTEEDARNNAIDATCVFLPCILSWLQLCCICEHIVKHIEPHWVMYECLDLCSPGFTCHLSIYHCPLMAPPPFFLTCQRQGMTGDKARVTDIDRTAIPSVRHGQGAASPCVTLSDRVEPCAWGGVMQLPDRRPAQQRWLYLCFTYMHTKHCF